MRIPGRENNRYNIYIEGKGLKESTRKMKASRTEA